MEQKIAEIERMQTEGAETTFKRMENAGEDLPFRSERNKFVVYNIAHSAVSPVCADGARVRILRGFATGEAAVDYAREVHTSDSSTVLIGETHAWLVCAASHDRLEDTEYMGAHTERMLAQYQEDLEDQRRRAQEHKLKLLHSITDVREWAEAIGLGDDAAEALAQWAEGHDFTVERCAVLTPEDAAEIEAEGGVPLSADEVRSKNLAWLKRQGECLGVGPKDPVPEEPAEPEDPVPEPAEPAEPAEPQAKIRRFDPSLRAAAQAVAVVSLVADPRPPPEAEPLLKIYGLFEATQEAEAYIRNTAGAHVHDHNMFIVDMYEFVPLTVPPDTRMTYRERMLQTIMEDRASQPGRVSALDKSIATNTPLGREQVGM
jgi:hypothetical protein